MLSFLEPANNQRNLRGMEAHAFADYVKAFACGATPFLLSFARFPPDHQREPSRDHQTWSTRPIGNDQAVDGNLPAEEEPEKMHEGYQDEEDHGDGCEWLVAPSLPYLE